MIWAVAPKFHPLSRRHPTLQAQGLETHPKSQDVRTAQNLPRRTTFLTWIAKGLSRMSKVQS